MIIQKTKIKKQISDFTHYCYGKTILPKITGKNYNYIPMMLHQKCSETGPLDLSKYSPCIIFSIHLEANEI